MNQTPVHEAIETMRSEADGLVMSRSRVIDGLLDLRLLTGDHEEAVAHIDELLSSVPGSTMVETEWWARCLDELCDALVGEAVPTGAC